MTPNEFILWLKGYIELSATSSLSAEAIKQKLDKIDLNSSQLSISPLYEFKNTIGESIYAFNHDIHVTGKKEMDEYIKKYQTENGFNDRTC